MMNLLLYGFGVLSTRMGFDSLEKFRGIRRCFDFKLYSDGYAFTVQFTRPLFLPPAEIRFQVVGVFDRDETYILRRSRSQSMLYCNEVN